MGRKITKTRRHKKLKFVDPCYTGPIAKAKKGKCLPNEPPSQEELHFDQQEIPAAVQKLIGMKSEAKQNQWKNKKTKKKKPNNGRIVVSSDLGDEKQFGVNRKQKSIPQKVVQKKKESRQQFFDRIQSMADRAIAEAEIKKKYDGEVIRDEESGEAKFLPNKQDPDAEPSERKKRKRLKEKEKKMKKKKSRSDDEDDAKFKKEDIKFGEVALQPPSLNVKPKRAVQSKAGARDLFLSKLLNKNSEENPKGTASSDLSQKRKMLLPGQRRMLEAERLRAVDLYRAMKQKNKS